MSRQIVTIDGNEAAAYVAYHTNEVIAIYPITPSSPIGEWADQWATERKQNIWGTVPFVQEMQSEGGAAGTVHGALQTGALSTTFTASQGLLLMIPNMYKIAGELTATVFHIAARSLAAQALSIFGDHSDVMAVRSTGWAMLCSNSVQEVMDFALIAQAATLEARVPFVHFFDGFRTSHEVMKIEQLSEDDLRAMIDMDLVRAHRARGLSPDHPVMRGAAQNPDVYFQGRETVNPYYLVTPAIVQNAMDKFADLVGRQYHLFDYVGAPDAERVIVMMGSGAETVQETVEYLTGKGEKVGLVKVRLYRPFAVDHFAAALPRTVKSIAALDRTKEPGAIGEPLYLDVVSALAEARVSGRTTLAPSVIGGRYGLSSKEFTPAQAKAVFDELLQAKPKPHFTVGIMDDVTHLSLPVDASFETESSQKGLVRAVFFGLGSDGTVGANKNSIKIIGEETDNFAQGYFVYDSKKAGAVTISHLRFGPRPVQSSYLVQRASFVACHQYEFMDKYDVLSYAEPGAVFLLNSPFGPDEIWGELSQEVQTEILEKKLKFYVIDGYTVARNAGMANRINTIMQTCFFAISGVLPKDEAISKIKDAIKKTYGKRGDAVVQANYRAVDETLANLHQVTVPAAMTATRRMPPVVSDDAPDFVKRVTAVMMANKGDLLPVSAFPIDGTWPTGTTKWEKRNIALDIPVWDEVLCIQCNKCAMVCPHAAIRAKVYPSDTLGGSPETFKSIDFKGNEFNPSTSSGLRMKYTIQVAPEDCTGCTLCVAVCPAKDKSNPKHKSLDMMPQRPLRESEAANYAFFLDLPEVDRRLVKGDIKGTQFLEPLFEYSGACAGCGETPYIKLVTQLFGDRAMIANATGCSSIYGANLPTTPYTVNRDGRGPTWSNSLFEDNAEFGFGMRLAVDKHADQARALVTTLAGAAVIGSELADGLLKADQSTETGVQAQRERVAALRLALAKRTDADATRLDQLADYLVSKSVWIVGGDGWAYDIGFGGLDHVFAAGRNVNVLVLDTEVYSNTGGQQSKATPMGAAAKFAMAGKATAKKDLAMMAMAYGNVYVARVAFGAKDAQTVKAVLEAESYPGTSVIIAYSHCIAHGYDLAFGLEQQKLAVDAGHWPLFRFDPRRVAEGHNPLVLESPAPKIDLGKYVRNESRYRMVEQAYPERFKHLLEQAQADIHTRFASYETLAGKTKE